MLLVPPPERLAPFYGYLQRRLFRKQGELSIWQQSLDTFSVIIIRLKERRPIYAGDKNRLVELGMTQRQAVWFIYLTTCALGVGVLLLPDLKSWGGVVIIMQSIAIISLISLLMFFGIRKRLNK